MVGTNHTKRTIKRLLISVSVFLIVCLLAFSGWYVYLITTADSSETVPISQFAAATFNREPEAQENAHGGTAAEDEYESFTTETTAPVLQFFQGKTDANETFQIKDMVPGDVVERYFCLRTYHETPGKIIFDGVITEQTNQLGDYLDVEICDGQTGEVLLQGTFNEINNFKLSKDITPVDGQSETYYLVRVSIDRWVGNECALSTLVADLHWSIEGGNSILTPHPQTGENFDEALWIAVAGCAVVIFVVLILTRKKEEDDDEQGSKE